MKLIKHRQAGHCTESESSVGFLARTRPEATFVSLTFDEKIGSLGKQFLGGKIQQLAGS